MTNFSTKSGAARAAPAAPPLTALNGVPSPAGHHSQRSEIQQW